MNIDRRSFLGSLFCLPAIGSAAAFCPDTKENFYYKHFYWLIRWWKENVTGEWGQDSEAPVIASAESTPEPAVAEGWVFRGRVKAEDVFKPLPEWIKVDPIMAGHASSLSPGGPAVWHPDEEDPAEGKTEEMTDDEFMEALGYGRNQSISG